MFSQKNGDPALKHSLKPTALKEFNLLFHGGWNDSSDGSVVQMVGDAKRFLSTQRFCVWSYTENNPPMDIKFEILPIYF
jgi:hypothetical protein